MNNSFNQSPSQQHQSNLITLADLDDTIRNYLIQLDKDYQTFKQRNDSHKEKFFESRKIGPDMDKTRRLSIIKNILLKDK